jgi:FHA domain
MTKPGDPTKPQGDERDRALARLEKALRDALERNDAAESLIEDQQQRLKSLGIGREESMRLLAEARDELKQVSRERDDLRKKLSRIDSMQTETIALPDDDPGLPPAAVAMPSLDDLMSELGDIDGPRETRVAGHLHQRVQTPDDSAGAEEMLSPELVFPEKFAATAASAEQQGPVSRVLVLLDPQRPIKYPLFKETMTIGRSDIADIQIDHGFLSRLHARIVSTNDGVAIEDIESKNGLRVNAKVVRRHALRHGDVVDLGRLRFRFIDTTADDAD